ncbi:lytic transglycosylase domain-containing protein [Roseibium salinum]|uniref:Transglycosylase SLT domain-containing protein n=1 Tax=Roseibium salinum TaxID=1604349 RepID=A0ABT3QY50_9HYPH|nr:transglycosylase SLT domain-containing protein [Roseibium sp. DSM 29163]MCX2721869.1 transglycosylase SLT domain-containing protein [Roseibium sp. DSM 29163]
MSLSFTKLAGALCLFAYATTLTAPGALAAGVSSGSEPILHILDADRETELASVDSKSSGTGSKSTSSHDKYVKLIRKAADKHGVPLNIAKAVVQVESNFNPRARGSAGEVGLMQIKPATARGIGYRGSTKALYDPETNLEWGMKYLAGAHQRANGDLCGTILRYNAGHYAKRMNPISSRYCSKVKRLMASS